MPSVQASTPDEVAALAVEMDSLADRLIAVSGASGPDKSGPPQAQLSLAAVASTVGQLARSVSAISGQMKHIREAQAANSISAGRFGYTPQFDGKRL